MYGSDCIYEVRVYIKTSPTPRLVHQNIGAKEVPPPSAGIALCCLPLRMPAQTASSTERPRIHSLFGTSPSAAMKLLRVAIFGAAVLLGATCTASSNSNGEDVIVSGSTDNDELVGRPSFVKVFFSRRSAH